MDDAAKDQVVKQRMEPGGCRRGEVLGLRWL